MKKKDLVKKWLNNEQLTHTESEVFKSLDAYDSYVKISDTAKKFKAPQYDVESNFKNLNSALKNRKKTTTPIRYAAVLMRIAALFIVGIATYFFVLHDSDITIKTLANQKTSIELSDHTLITLNALSSVVYTEKDWENNRNILLKGEAYFKVTKGEKFNVHTSSGLISVLGTEFNVKQRDGYFEVSCFEGLVSVAYNKTTVKLSAGKSFRLLGNKIFHEETDALQPDWIENKSIFSSTPYLYVLKEFERQYNVTIIANNIDQNILFTGNFVHSDIQTALQSITIPMRLKYKINNKNNNITLYKE